MQVDELAANQGLALGEPHVEVEEPDPRCGLLRRHGRQDDHRSPAFHSKTTAESLERDGTSLRRSAFKARPDRAIAGASAEVRNQPQRASSCVAAPSPGAAPRTGAGSLRERPCPQIGLLRVCFRASSRETDLGEQMTTP